MKKKNKIKDLILSLVGALLLAIFLAIPLMTVGYAWLLYALKDLPLWIPIVITVVCSLAESLCVICDLEK